MSNSNHILKKSLDGTIILACLTLLQFIFTLITQIILARNLLPDDFGIAAFCVAISFFFVTASGLSGDKFFLSESKETDLNQIITTELFLSFIVFLLANIGLPFFLDFIDKKDHLIYCQLLLFLCFYNPLSRPRVLLEKKLEFYQAKKYFFLAQVLSSVIAVIAVYFESGIWSIILWRFSALFLEVLFLNILLSFNFKLTLPSAHFYKKLVNFGFPMTVASVAVYFYGNVDYYLISTFLNPDELGYYWLAYQFTNQILQARKIVVSVAIPSFVNLSSKEVMKTSFEVISKTLVWLFSIPFFIFFVFEDKVVSLLFGDSWLLATDLFIVFSIVILLKAVTTLLEPICVKYQKTKVFMNITLISSVLMVLMGLSLIQLYGLKGMSIAVLLTTLATTVISLWFISSILSVSLLKSVVQPLFFVFLFAALSKQMLFFLEEKFNFLTFINVFIVIFLYLILFIFLENKMLNKGLSGVKKIFRERSIFNAK
jgi:O-antigen/teichoic acid export membrane protein